MSGCAYVDGGEGGGWEGGEGEGVRERSWGLREKGDGEGQRNSG